MDVCPNGAARRQHFAAAASPHFIKKYKKENEKYEIQDRKRKEKTRDRSRFRTFDHS
jgi:hypothetical protein